MKEEKSGALLALGPALPFSFTTLPAPISKKGGAARAPHQTVHDGMVNHRQGERIGLVI